MIAAVGDALIDAPLVGRAHADTVDGAGRDVVDVPRTFFHLIGQVEELVGAAFGECHDVGRQNAGPRVGDAGSVYLVRLRQAVEIPHVVADPLKRLQRLFLTQHAVHQRIVVPDHAAPGLDVVEVAQHVAGPQLPAPARNLAVVIAFCQITGGLGAVLHCPILFGVSDTEFVESRFAVIDTGHVNVRYHCHANLGNLIPALVPTGREEDVIGVGDVLIDQGLQVEQLLLFRPGVYDRRPGRHNVRRSTGGHVGQHFGGPAVAVRFPQDFDVRVFLIVAGESLVLVVFSPLDAGHIGEPVEAGKANLGPFARCLRAGRTLPGC